MKKVFFGFLIVLFLGVVGYALVNYWPYIFARTVKGKIVDVQKVSPQTLIVGGSGGGSGGATATEMFSFAVGIQEADGEIVTASSEDRQWAVAQPGHCAEAKYYPYPPWDFEKSGTYFGARLIRLNACADSGSPGLQETQTHPAEDK
jgi:hypothetical protein